MSGWRAAHPGARLFRRQVSLPVGEPDTPVAIQYASRVGDLAEVLAVRPLADCPSLGRAGPSFMASIVGTRR